jgi:hypothetical protein
MADFTLQIQEKVTLGGIARDSSVTQVISNISYADNRILTVPVDSITTIFSFATASNAGTFLTSSFKYGRITNKSTTVPVKLIVSSSVESMSYLINAGSSFMLSTTAITGSTSGLLFNNIASVKVEPSGSAADIEYFIIGT